MLSSHTILLDPSTDTTGSPPKQTFTQKSVGDVLKPQMPITVPTEIQGMEFNIDQLPSSDDIVPSTPELEKKTTAAPVKEDKKSTEVAKVEPKKEDEKKSEITHHLKPPVKAGEEKKTEEVKKEEKKTQVTVPKNDSFDYGGYSQQEVNLLKNMSIESRKFAGDLIKQNKELAKAKDSNYLQHPEAYRLDPQYQAGLVDIQFANKEAQYWQKQLELAKLGKPVRNLLQWDNKGNPVVGEEIAANDGIEETLRLNYQNAMQAGNAKRNELQQYPQKYKQQIDNDMGIINQTRGQIFEWNNKPELMDYTIHVEGLGDRSIKQIKDDFRNLWPTYMRNHIAVDTAADFMVALRIRDSELAEARASKEVTETKMEEVKRAEPSTTIRPGRELQEVNGIKEFSDSGMSDLN